MKTEEATAFLKDLGGRIAAVTKERRVVEFLLQRISVAIQRGNAACVYLVPHRTATATWMIFITSSSSA